MDLFYVWGGFLLVMSAVNMGVSVKLQRQMRALQTRMDTMECPVPVYTPPPVPPHPQLAQIVKLDYGNPQNV